MQPQYPGWRIFIPYGGGQGAEEHCSLHPQAQLDRLTQSKQGELLAFLLFHEVPEPHHLPVLVSGMGFPFPVLGFVSVSWGGHSHGTTRNSSPSPIWERLWPLWGTGMSSLLLFFEHVLRSIFVVLWVSWVTLTKWISFKWLLQNKVLGIFKLIIRLDYKT